MSKKRKSKSMLVTDYGGIGDKFEMLVTIFAH